MARRLPLLLLILAAAVIPFSDSFSRDTSSDLYKKGARLALDGEIDGAVGMFKKAVEMSPYSCLGHYGLGKAYLYKYGMVDDAIKHLRKSVTLDRGFAKGYFYLGLAYYLKKSYIQALHAFKKSYQLDYTFMESLYNIGAIYDIMDNSYQSTIYFRKYLKEKRGSEEEEEILFE